MARQEAPALVEAGDYAGQSAVRISCTQLGGGYSATQARQVVAGWVDFLASAPSQIRSLEFTTRTPKRLFAALGAQTQLQRLVVKWGDYEDLSVLTELHNLTDLSLRGASSVTRVDPVATLTNLRQLELEGLKRAHDMAPLGQLRELSRLELGGDWMAPRNAHIDSLKFLPNLEQLEELLLHTIIVDDHDYSPLLALPRLKAVRVMKTRGMTPAYEDLQAQLPWSS